jgi:hypothetical protein
MTQALYAHMNKIKIKNDSSLERFSPEGLLRCMPTMQKEVESLLCVLERFSPSI